MAVRILAVQEQVARNLDLVRGVVDVEPGIRRVAETDLEERRREDQEADDDRAERRDQCRPHRSEAEHDRGAESDREPGDEGCSAQEGDVEVTVGRFDEPPEGALSVSPSRSHLERPGARAQLGDRDEDEDSERAEDGGGFAARHLALGTGSAWTWPASAGAVSSSRTGAGRAR